MEALAGASDAVARRRVEIKPLIEIETAFTLLEDFAPEFELNLIGSVVLV
jgi:hypothetical protein